MKTKSQLQRIEDFYIRQGYDGERLRKKLIRDKEYQKLLKAKKQKLTNKFKINPIEKKKYVLSTDSDFIILNKCKKLEKKKLDKRDKQIINLIKNQLEEDWRTPLIKYLNKLLRKYLK